MSEVARSETAVLGVVTLRDRLLPLVSLRALLGLPSDLDRKARQVVVLSMGSSAVGMVAGPHAGNPPHRPGLIDPAPALLTRGAGDAEITSICRLDHGKRLVAVLSPERLFRSDLVRRVLSEQQRGRCFAGRNGWTCDGRRAIDRLSPWQPGIWTSDRAVDEIARPPDASAGFPRRLRSSMAS